MCSNPKTYVYWGKYYHLISSRSTGLNIRFVSTVQSYGHFHSSHVGKLVKICG